jgi:hypothetical protein
MTYDHWKATNPADEWLGPDPDDQPYELNPEMNNPQQINEVKLTNSGKCRIKIGSHETTQ